MNEYIIHYAGKPQWLDYIVEAKDANDARTMGEVWGKRWDNGQIESIKMKIRKEK